jgi:SnoaL-like polyketide cyclase
MTRRHHGARASAGNHDFLATPRAWVRERTAGGQLGAGALGAPAQSSISWPRPFLGTHTGEFLGMPASGKSVQVPYCVVYDLQHDKIAALRAYIPMDLFAQQLR